jgi:hypothetical protein
MVATNAAALAVAERHGVSAPRLLGADLDGRDAALPATLETVIHGASTWPAAGPTSLLRAAGDATAQVHHIVLTSQRHLPLRPRPIGVDDFAQERRLGRCRRQRCSKSPTNESRPSGLPTCQSSSSTVTCGPET